MIKFNSAFDKNYLLNSVARYCKRNHSQLRLHDLGIESNDAVYLHESLTKHSHMLMKHALVLKKKKRIASAFTYRGLIYVRREPKSEALTVNSLECLAAITDDVGNNSSMDDLHIASVENNTYIKLS